MYIVFCAVHLSDLGAWSTQSSGLSSCFVSPKRAQVVKEQSLKEFPVDPYSSLFCRSGSATTIATNVVKGIEEQSSGVFIKARTTGAEKET